MKKILYVLMAVVLVSSMSLQAYGEGHSGTRSNRHGKLRADDRSDKVHQLNAAKKKKGHKDKDRDNDKDNRKDKDKGKEKGENKKH